MKPVGVGRAGRKPQVPRSSAKRQLGSGHGALAGESCQTLAGAAPEPSKGADRRLEQDQERTGRQEAVGECGKRSPAERSPALQPFSGRCR